MNLTAEQANALLINAHTEAELRAIISQLDTNTHGGVTVLYSGSLSGANVHSMDAITQLKNNPDLRVLDNTEAFKFLDCLPNNPQDPESPISNALLNQKLKEIFGGNPSEYGSPANQFLFGAKNELGQRIPNGAFDMVSTNFAKGGQGHAVALVGFANEGQVFGASELPTSLKDSGFTHVNGIPTETLRNVAQTEGMSEAFGIVRTQSQIDTMRISYTVDANGKVTGLDTGDLLSTRYGVQDTRPNPNLTNGHITHRVSEDLDRVRQTHPEKFAPLRPEHHQYKTVYQTPHIDAQIQPSQQSLSQKLTPFQQAYQRDQLDQTFEQKTIRPHSVDTKHINSVLQSEQKHSIEYQTEQAAKARQIQLERAAEIHPQTTHSKTPHIAGKVIGAAGIAVEAGLGYIEVKDAIKQANSTREQYVAGFEAGGNAAIKSAVTGVAGFGGGVVGGAGGAITPVPGGAAIGAIGVGGAAAYGAGELYEDSASQRAVKAVSRGAGEFAYDHISKEGRLASDIRDLKEQISQTSDSAKTRALNEQLNQTTQAFNVEADKNARQIGAEHALDATRTDIKKDNPKLWNVSLDSQLDRAVEQGYSGNEAVRIAVGNAAARDTNVSAVHSDQLRTLAQNANFNAKQAEIQTVTDALSNGRAMNYERQQAIERKVMASEWRDVQSVTDVLTAARNGELKLNPVHKVEHHYVKTVVTHKPMGLHQGDHGENVKQLQNALKLLGADIEADGHFGKSTTQALKDFQKEHHLKVDGELDRKTGQTLVNELKALDVQQQSMTTPAVEPRQDKQTTEQAVTSESKLQTPAIDPVQAQILARMAADPNFAQQVSQLMGGSIPSVVAEAKPDQVDPTLAMRTEQTHVTMSDTQQRGAPTPAATTDPIVMPPRIATLHNQITASMTNHPEFGNQIAHLSEKDQQTAIALATHEATRNMARSVDYVYINDKGDLLMSFDADKGFSAQMNLKQVQNNDANQMLTASVDLQQTQQQEVAMRQEQSRNQSSPTMTM